MSVIDNELRIRKAVMVPEDESQFVEEIRHPLSNKDRDFVLALLDSPPKPNPQLKKAAREYRRHHG